MSTMSDAFRISEIFSSGINIASGHGSQISNFFASVYKIKYINPFVNHRNRLIMRQLKSEWLLLNQGCLRKGLFR